jgi:hypothetical protein
LPSIGDGAVTVNHDTGGPDALAYKTSTGSGIDNAVMRAYLKTDYDTGNRTSAFVRAQTSTNAQGRWQRDMHLDPGQYVIEFVKQGQFGPDITPLTIT